MLVAVSRSRGCNALWFSTVAGWLLCVYADVQSDVENIAVQGAPFLFPRGVLKKYWVVVSIYDKAVHDKERPY